MRTCTGDFTLEEETAKVSANNSQSSYEKSTSAELGGLETAKLPSNKKQPFRGQKYAQCMHLKMEEIAARQLELAKLVEVWHSQPDHIRTAIMTLVTQQ